MVFINLDDYRTIDKKRNVKSRVFSGRERGEEVRKKSRLDEYVKKRETIHIQVPNDIFSINPSFLEEFLSTAVKVFGKNKFSQYVIFDEPFKFKCQLDEAVDRIARSSTALD